MLSFAYFAIVPMLAVLALTRKRVFIICGFYCFYALLTVLDQGSVPHLGPFTLYRALYAIIAVSLLARWVQDPEFPIQMRRWPLFSYGFLLVLLLASSLYSQTSQPFSGDSGALWGRLAVVSLFWLAACHLQHESDLKIFAGTTVVISLVLCAWVIWSAANLNFQAYRGGIKADQNYVSGFVMTGALPLVNSFVTAKKRSARLVSAMFLFCVFFTSLLLASLGMFAGFAVAAFAIAISTLGWRRRTLMTASAILIVAFGIGLLLPGGQNLLGRLKEPELRTLDSRTRVWSYSLQYFGDSSLLRMIFGQGLGSDPPILNPVAPELGNYHNDYLRWLMDRGIVGLMAFLLFLVNVWRRIVYSNHRLKPVLIGWFVFLVMASLSEAASDGHLFWIVMGIACAGGASAACTGSPHQFVLASAPKPGASDPSLGHAVVR